MNIALIAHDAKKELMVQFCIAYCGLLSRHTLCATGTTGKLVAEATGLKVQRFLSGVQGGDQQIAARIACNEVDLLLFFRDPLTASYFVAVWKMLRKKGCVPSALTQNVKDLLASREIEAILDNTDFMILLSQAQSDRAILAKQLGISEHQLSYITHSNSGEGLLFYGSVTIPFVDRFPKGEIYDLLTTRPEDMKNEAKTE